MSTRQYGIDKVELTWAGLDLKEGVAVGTFLQEARTGQNWTVKPTGTGGIVRTFNPDRSGTVTVTMDQESKTHQQLNNIALLDRVGRNQVFPMVMYDTSSKETYSYINAFILGEPDEGRATESLTFAWVWGFERKEKITPADDANIVGN